MSTRRPAKRRARLRANRRATQHRRRMVFGIAGAALVGTLAVGGITINAVGSSLNTRLESNEFVPIRQGQNTRIYDKDGKLLGYIAGTTNRTEIRSKRIPKFLKQATVAIEDKRFYEHDGVDYYRLAGAAVKDIQTGSAREGGSTITMQLMKNLYKPGAGRTVAKKVEESFLAYQYEKRFTKDEILAKYLNGVFYGNNARGVQAASLTYFSKNVWEITLPQAALLAGLPQAPSDYDPLCDPASNPRCDPDAALERRNLVLDQMAEQGYVTVERAEKAKKATLQLKPGNAYKVRKEGFFFEYVREKLLADKDIGKQKVQRGGLKVYTTIDRELQSDARTAIQQVLGQPDDPASAVVMIDSRTGSIRAMTSSRRFSPTDQFNLAADAKRQSGSTFKTFVLTEAIRRGMNPASTYYASKKLDFYDPTYGQIDVSTYSNGYSGVIPITRATLSSDNSVYTQMTLGLGPKNVIETAYEMGIPRSRELPDVASIGLGSGLVTPLDMATAYAPLSNGGFRVKPNGVFRIEQPNGDVQTNRPQRERVFDDGVAYEVTKILRANVTGGTGTAANIDGAIAGKTGTTDNYVDAWFVGYTPCYTTAVWMGYPENAQRSMFVRGSSVSGGGLPTQIWAAFMRKVLEKRPCNITSFPLPENPASFSSYSDEYTRAASEVTPSTPSTTPTSTTGAESTTDANTEATPPPPPPEEIPPPAPAPIPTPVDPAPAPEPTPAPAPEPAPAAEPPPPPEPTPAPPTGTTP